MREYLNKVNRVESIYYVYMKINKEILKAFKNLELAKEYKKEMEKELNIGKTLLMI